MIFKRILQIAAMGAALHLSSCDGGESNNTEENSSKKDTISVKMDTLTLALDWRPNVLHSGIFLAQARGFYQEQNIHLEWFTPEVDGYTVKPLKKVLQGKADLSVGPSEHLFHYAVDSSGLKAQAVATLLQKDMSAFVAKAESGIDSPSDISGKTYLGYDTPLENEVLAGMISNDGGEPEFETELPGRLELWEAFKAGKGDVAWVFLHWEAALARHEGEALNSFVPNDYGVPYGYSSVVMAPTDMDSSKQELVRRFLEATKRGYRAMKNEPAAALGEVMAFVDHPNFSDSSFIAEAQATITPAYFSKNGDWGRMEAEKWRNYLQWMKENELLEYDRIEGIEPGKFFTNKFLP